MLKWYLCVLCDRCPLTASIVVLFIAFCPSGLLRVVDRSTESMASSYGVWAHGEIISPTVTVSALMEPQLVAVGSEINSQQRELHLSSVMNR